jgi:peptidoglycan/LPS O-acetylase OafA/YrhL
MIARNHLSSIPRDPELDGLRGLAVAMVLLWHFIGIPAWSTPGWLPQALFKVFLLGGAGVDLFFVLSGFLITRIIIKRSQSDLRFLLAFYFRRALRILPPYFLLVLLFWIVVGAGINNTVFNADTPLWMHLTFTQNFWLAEHGTYGPDGIGVTWSVAIEEQYYLVFPLLALLLPRKSLPWALFIITFSSIVFRSFIFTMDPQNNFPADLHTLARLDGLAVGGLIACAFSDTRSFAWLRKHNALIMRVMVTMVVLTFFLVKRTSGAQMAYFGHTFLTILFGLVIINVLLNLGSSARWMRILRSKPLLFLGKISYSVYLFHPLVLASAFLFAGLPKTLSGVEEIALLISSLALTLFLCNLMFNKIEQPLIAMGRKQNY